MEARIIPEWIKHGIEPEQRRRGLVIAPLYGIESSFCKAAMARSDSPVTAATRAKISRRFGPSIALFSNRPAASWLLARQVVFQNVCE